MISPGDQSLFGIQAHCFFDRRGDLAMRLPCVWITVERLMIALAAVLAGSLVLGSISRIPAEVAEADAIIFGTSYGAEIGLAVVLAIRYLRQPTSARIRPTRAAMAIVIVIAWATISFPIVRDWAYHASCGNLYRRDPLAELDPAKRRDLISLHLRLRRAYQNAMLRPWKVVALDE
jgi:hypothetical protein